MLEKKIYSPWAFSENEKEKGHINYEIYKELKDKAEVVYQNQLDKITDEMKKEKAYLLDYKHGYAHTDYKVLSNPNSLTASQLALICDDGNLCFGHSFNGNTITIFTD